MTTLKCRECGRYFDEPSIVNEYRGEFWGSPAYEPMSYCPYCDSEDFDEDYVVESEESDNDES